MISDRTVILADASAHANVLAALTGPGAPAGIVSCVADGATIGVAFDAELTPPELIDALIVIAARFVPARGPEFRGPAQAAAVAARGLREPRLDAARIIETYLP